MNTHANHGDIGTTMLIRRRRAYRHFDGRTITFVFGELDTLVLAYDATIHKRAGATMTTA